MEKVIFFFPPQKHSTITQSGSCQRITRNMGFQRSNFQNGKCATVFPYLNLELELGVDGIHHLGSLHCASSFITLSYHLLTHMCTCKNTEKEVVAFWSDLTLTFLQQMSRWSAFNISTSTYLADCLQSPLTLLKLWRVFGGLLTNCLQQRQWERKSVNLQRIGKTNNNHQQQFIASMCTTLYW